MLAHHCKTPILVSCKCNSIHLVRTAGAPSGFSKRFPTRICSTTYCTDLNIEPAASKRRVDAPQSRSCLRMGFARSSVLPSTSHQTTTHRSVHHSQSEQTVQVSGCNIGTLLSNLEKYRLSGAYHCRGAHLHEWFDRDSIT